MFLEVTQLEEKVRLIREKLGKEKIETISDLQTLMITKERLNEVKETLAKFSQSSNQYYTAMPTYKNYKNL